MLARLSNQVDDDFGIAAGLENRSLSLHAAANFLGIGQVAIVREGNHALVGLHHDRLRVEES